MAAAALLLALFATAAQPEIRVSSGVEPSVVKLGGSAVLRLVVTGTDDVKLEPIPPVKGLSFGAPSPSRMQKFDSRIGSSLTIVLSYLVTPDSEGTYEIPSLKGTAGGKGFETRPLRLEVVRDFRGASAAFLEVKGPGRPVYRGETFQVEATFG